MASSRFDPQPPARSGAAADNAIASEPQVHGPDEDDAAPPSDGELLSVIARAQSISKDYQIKTVDRSLGRAYRAWQNQHAEGSKYLGPAFKGRSRLFVPKTRAAVRKNLAAAAGALFATEDVTSISATFEDDVQQRATAATIKADLEYRLTRSSALSGMPWFQIAMGACLDSQLTAVCISKQFWEYEEVLTNKVQIVEEYLVNPQTGQPEIDPQTGHPIIIERQEPIYRTTKDRPMVELHPIENAGLDPAAPWHSPVQLGRWFYMRYPMGISDAMAMLRSANKRGDKMWREDITEELLRKGRTEDERSANRRVREGGGDRYEDGGRAGGALDLVWIQENFVRIDGRDWHFWSVGQFGLLSDPREVIEAYPEFGGERPYVMGVSQLDTHRVFPQSPVETWQPLQHELNDVTNLRLDTLKRAIAPLTLAKRGKNVDLQALQRRGQPENIVMVDSMDDVLFTPTPAPSGAAYQETSITNANFDELAGVFSTSSVQTSRQLNETVGGMNLMSRAAGSVSEFDLRIWIETWVEPVLRHLVHLVRYYETDERIVAIAGQQARAWSRYQYMPNLDDFEQCDVTVRVNAGIGTVDPMQKLQKMEYAFKLLAPLMPEAAAQGISINIEQIIEEVMGSAGFRDGRRFFEFNKETPQAEPPPEMIKIMKDYEAKMAKIEADSKKGLMEIMVKLEGIKSGERQSAADNEAVISAAEIEWTGRHALQAMSLGANAEQTQATHINDMRRSEAQAAEQYRMKQWEYSKEQQSAPAARKPAQPDVSGHANVPQITDVLQALSRQLTALTQKVNAQDALLGAIFGQGNGAQPVMQ